ncbi:MAG: UvrD-helicase domain-containing protein [Chloroflexi bacterium]|nr:UvrD-helicase domain-containing protein [Chloroflexota bacterium]
MAELNLTPNQDRASNEHGKNYVVVASAGAGKTRVLVERYLTLLERGYALPSIVAITFTEKAASEMRDRVRRAIEERAQRKNSWRKHLEEIDAAQIGTIHSLCARLIRANPAEAQIDPRFEVLEETNATILQDESIDVVLADLAESGGDALALLNEYEVRVVRETLSDLFKRADAVTAAFARLPENVDALYAEWQARLSEAQCAGWLKLLNGSAWRNTIDWICNNAATKSDDKLELVRSEFERHLQSIDANDVAKTILILRQVKETKVGNVGSKNAWDDPKAARGVVMQLRELAKEFCDTFDLEFGEDDRRSAERIFQWRDVWLKARAKYSQAKTARRVLDFNDLEELARNLLQNHSTVRERYQSEFATVMVDEYQDTNAAQRDIIYALASPDQADRLFVVADGKQSIYGFRGADVSVFTQTKQDVRRWWGDDAIIPLRESFRAHRKLGDAFNYLFERIMAVEGKRAPFEIEYDAMQAVRPSLERNNVIEIISIPKDDITDGERRVREAEELARRLRALIDERFQVWDKQANTYRAATWGDVALLFRATTHFSTYEDAFKQAQIPYVTFAGKGYYDRPEVRDLIQLLRALDNPRDDLAIATVLRSPLYVLSDETLYRLRRNGQSLRDALAAIPSDVHGAERTRAEFAHTSLEELWRQVGRVSILDSLKIALERTGYLATLTALTDGERRRANVEKLLALARRTGLVRLSELNAYLQDLTAQEVREGEAVIEAEQAVRLMSIHRAKGLEFPIVIIPDASHAPRTNSDLVLADRVTGVAVTVRDLRGKTVQPVAYKLMKVEEARREEAEEKRLLYVAATRAQDYLIISGSNKPSEKSYLWLIQEALQGQSAFDWGTIETREPTIDFSADLFTPTKIELRIQVDETTESAIELPKLIAPLASPQVHDLRLFSPTGLQQLVDNPIDFERRVLEGAPDRIKHVTPSKSGHSPAYIIGEMAHRAIQQWRFAGPTLERILRGYAEEQGLADAGEIDAAVHEAKRLLHSFADSDLYREMERAAIRRTEVPLVAQWEGRILHGALDALCQSVNGQWFIVDFKTDRYHHENVDSKTYTLQRYGVQLALYQFAVAPRFGDVSVCVHYIREKETLVLNSADLADALTQARQAVL